MPAVLRLEHPVGVPGSGVDFVPPAEADKAPAGDVFQVVEVGGEEEHGEDEDEDAVLGGGWGVSEGGGGKGDGGGTNKLLVKKGM